MPLQVIMMSRDTETVQLLKRAMSQAHIRLLVCAEATDCLRALEEERFEAIVVDCSDVQNTYDVLSKVSTSRFWHKQVAIAITDEFVDLRSAFKLGSNLVLYKPLTAEKISRIIHAAEGLMFQERRRHFRCPVNETAWLEVEKGVEVPVTLCELSESGLSVQSQKSIPTGEFRMRFRLPKIEKQLSLRAATVWVTEDGRSGLRIVQINPSQKAIILRWLSERLVEHQGIRIASAK